MLHEPAADWGKDFTLAYKKRIGVTMFLIYCVIYAGFVLINDFRPRLMEVVLLGQNLAVWYGFGLIVIALIMAVIYTSLCTKAEQRLNNQRDVL